MNTTATISLIREQHGRFKSGDRFIYDGRVYKFDCRAECGNVVELRATASNGRKVVFVDSRDWEPLAATANR